MSAENCRAIGIQAGFSASLVPFPNWAAFGIHLFEPNGMLKNKTLGPCGGQKRRDGFLHEICSIGLVEK